MVKNWRERVGGKNRSKLARMSARLPVRGWITKVEEEHQESQMSHVTCMSHHKKSLLMLCSSGGSIICG